MLGEETVENLRVLVLVTRYGFKLTSQELEEGRFTCSVVTNNCNLRIGVNSEVKIIIDDFVRAVAEFNIFNSEER